MPKLFFLSRSDSGPRLSGIPSPDDYDGVEAPDWLHAKKALGFELTPLQTQMLPLDLAGRMQAQLNDAHYGRSAVPWSRS